MHIVEAFGRIFISTLFIFEAIKKFLFKEETIFYMLDYGIPEILFYPALLFEIVFPILLIIGYQTKISALAMFVFTIVVTIVFHNDFGDQIHRSIPLPNYLKMKETILKLLHKVLKSLKKDVTHLHTYNPYIYK